MALVRFGTGVAEIRGSVGGSVYSRARGGATIRNRITPINPNTSFQDDARQRFSDQTSAYSSLTIPQLLSWETLASTAQRSNVFGETYTPSPKQLFMEINLNRDLAAMTQLLSAPASAVRPLPPQPSLVLPFAVEPVQLLGVLTALVVVNGSAQTGVKWNVYATPPLSPAVRDGSRYFRFIQSTNPAATVNIFDAYEDRYGEDVPANAGDIIIVQLKSVDTTNGVASDPIDIVGVVA